jgi:hypothetical protein
MASTITITCPECDKSLKAPPTVIGKKIRCKSCGHTFAAKAPPGKAGKPGAKGAKKDDEEGGGSYGVTKEYLGPRCPDCANAMEEGDIVCLHCGYNTVSRQKARTRKVRDTTAMDVFVWLLPGILCVLLIGALVTVDLIYILSVNEEQFGGAWYDFVGGKALKIWASIITVFCIYLAGKFAVRRLIFNYWPPEIEEKMVK